MTTVPNRISTGLTKEALAEAVAKVRDLTQELEEARYQRNDLVLQCMELGVPVTQISRMTGLSRNHIYQMRTEPQE